MNDRSGQSAVEVGIVAGIDNSMSSTMEVDYAGCHLRLLTLAEQRTLRARCPTRGTSVDALLANISTDSVK